VRGAAARWRDVCLRSSRMLSKLGFVASVLSEGISTSRTCRLSNATPLRLRELIEANLDALDRVLTFLERHEILLYRITSNLIPFASHPVNSIRWWEVHAAQLAVLGRRIAALGVRVSLHPGQYTVLNSPTPQVVAASVAELHYHAQLLRALDTGPEAKIVLHVGGLYGGSEQAAMERFCAVASELPEEVRQRLVVENDDRLFDAEEALTVARRIGVPVVFDWLHHNANPCRTPLNEVLAAIFETWTTKDGPPKVHLSSQAGDGPVGAHADFVDPADALAFFAVTPPQPFDCMLEAKEKDRALLKLRAELRTRGVAEAALRDAGISSAARAPRAL
jgi:UV DNA damage endonuclease